MKKAIIVIILLAGMGTSLFAQREIPMFFDREMGLEKWSFIKVMYSPDGSRIAVTFGGNRKIVIWDIATVREITRLAGHDKEITGIVFSQNGKQIASCAVNDTAMKIWDTQSGAW